MTLPRFIQVHSLVSYSGVLLNRDDAGMAKRLSYGGVVRTRISSQCLKRHWRRADDDWGLERMDIEQSVRTRLVFERAILPQVVAETGASGDVVSAVMEPLVTALYGKDAKARKSRSALLLGWPEIRYLRHQVAELVRGMEDPAEAKKAAEERFKGKDAKKVLSTIEHQSSCPAGLTAALFGRMVTSDVQANTEAAIHVAHAFTVHEQEPETDYFTVVDDLVPRNDPEDAVSAGIFDTEITSGTFYIYAVADVPTLVSNLCGCEPGGWTGKDVDRELPAKVVEHLVHLIATVSPGAKRGSTAPYAHAQTMLVEVGSRQPRSLASAFEEPVQPRAGESVGRLAESALLNRLSQFDRTYGQKEVRHLASIEGTQAEGISGPEPLDALAAWAAECVRRGEA